MSELTGPALNRVVAVLALLAGLLSMHALGGGVHSAHAAAADLTTRPSAAVLAPSHEGHAATRVDVSAQGVTTDPAVMPDLAGASGAEDGLDLSVACLAVLLSVLVMTVLRRLVRTLPRPAAAVRPSWDRTAAPSRGPPRDLLAQLCVLRT